MPQQSSQGATTQQDPAPTTYKVTIIKQQIYEVDVPVLEGYPTAAGAEEAYDDALGQMLTRHPQIEFSGKVEWIRPGGQLATWEAPTYNPDEPISED